MKTEQTNPTSGIHVSIRGDKHRASALYIYYQKFTKLLTHIFPGLGERNVKQIWIDGSATIRTPKVTLNFDKDGNISFGDVIPYEGEGQTL